MAATLQLMAALLLLTPLAQSQGDRRKPPPTRVALNFLPPGMDLNNPGGGGSGGAEPTIFFPSNMPFMPEARGGDESSEIDNMENMDMATLRTLNKVNTIEEWADMMGVDVPDDEEPAQNDTLLLRSGIPGTSTAIMAVKAGCAVETRTVELTLPSNGKTYFPTCVRLPRCAGCCQPAKLLQCRPTKVNRVSFKIMQVTPSGGGGKALHGGNWMRYNRNGAGSLERGRSEDASRTSGRRKKRSSNFHIVEEEEHVTCDCQCHVRETDCDPAIQTYDKTNCQCACNNKDEMKKCQGLSTHYWDKSTCKCRCTREETCSHSQYMDQTSCTCMNLAGLG